MFWIFEAIHKQKNQSISLCVRRKRSTIIFMCENYLTINNNRQDELNSMPKIAMSI
jgi:hypothetical protein